MWLQGRGVFMWSRLYNELADEVGPETAERWATAARLGANFLSKGKDAQGKLLFAVSRDGSRPLHFQRKPYAAVFYCLACLEYAQVGSRVVYTARTRSLPRSVMHVAVQISQESPI